MKTKRVAIRIAPTQLRQIKIAAQRDHRNVSDWFRALARRELSRRGIPTG